jgi:hypothetical protein
MTCVLFVCVYVCVCVCSHVAIIFVSFYFLLYCTQKMQLVWFVYFGTCLYFLCSSTSDLILWVSVNIYIFDNIGVWTQGQLTLTQSLFSFSYFSDCGLNQNSVSHIAGITGVHHHAWLVCWDEILRTFCPSSPQTTIIRISTS